MNEYAQKRQDAHNALTAIFGGAYTGSWLKNDKDKPRHYIYPIIANCYYRISVIDMWTEARGNGNKRPPELFVKLVESELKKHFATAATAANG